MVFQRKIVEAVAARMREDDNPLIQVLAGPRQTGKSTAIAQALEKVDKPAHSASADDVIAPDVQWWREGNDEVDFVLAGEGKLAAIEVKSGRTKSQGGMAAFLREYPEATRIVVGGSAADAVTVEDFLLGNITLPWS